MTVFSSVKYNGYSDMDLRKYHHVNWKAVNHAISNVCLTRFIQENALICLFAVSHDGVASPREFLRLHVSPVKIPQL